MKIRLTVNKNGFYTVKNAKVLDMARAKREKREREAKD